MSRSCLYFLERSFRHSSEQLLSEQFFVVSLNICASSDKFVHFVR